MMRARGQFVTAVGALAAALLLAAPGAANDLGRDREPIVLLGSSFPDLTGAPPELLVGFAYDGGWVQIPIQVDERAVFDFGTIYGGSPSGYTVLTYADTSTFTGADPDPTFDANDELVVMASDAGVRSAAGSEPSGTVQGSGVELAITNPVTSAVAYVYLFQSDGSLDPGNGEVRVAYAFDLLSGPYKTTYNTSSGPNPEDTDVTSPVYAVHFSDRWIRNETRVTEAGATGIDILDRHKNLFAPGNCTRSENTFSNGEGAFIVNHGGALRVLRAYVGANSGPTTHRVHAFYEEREDIVTVLRVHPISGVMDYFDYSAAAAGMTYRDDLNPGGVLIDGTPDGVLSGPKAWEMVTGPQGTLAVVPGILTDIPGFTYTSYYSDDTTPPNTQCTGDPYEYGASGIWVNHSIPNTDPALGAYYVFEGHRRVAYGPPSQGVEFASDFLEELEHPVVVDAAPYVPTASVEAPSESDSVPDAFRCSVRSVPAVGTASLGLTMPTTGHVRVELYTISGRLAAVLADKPLAVGEHTLVCALPRLASGVYMVRAVGPRGQQSTANLVVLR
jgi:hypothetical protein